MFLHLAAEINWYRLFHELIDDFDETVLDSRQQTALAAVGVPSAVSAQSQHTEKEHRRGKERSRRRLRQIDRGDHPGVIRRP